MNLHRLAAGLMSAVLALYALPPGSVQAQDSVHLHVAPITSYEELEEEMLHGRLALVENEEELTAPPLFTTAPEETELTVPPLFTTAPEESEMTAPPLILTAR